MRLAFITSLAACGDPPPPPQAADYDATCATVEDCVVVTQDGHCGFGCPFETCLSAEGAASFEADQAAYDPRCDEMGLVACTQTSAVTCACAASTCVVETTAQ